MTTDTLIIESDEGLVSKTASEVASSPARVSRGLVTAEGSAAHNTADHRSRFASKQMRGNGSQSTAISRPVEIESLTLSQLCRDLIELTKPRIVVMILVTTLATAYIGAGQAVQFVDLCWLLLGTGLIAASAGAANQVWEREIDKKMARTASRPVTAGRVNWIHAALYTIALGFAGCLIILERFHYVPAAVGLSTWLLYVLVYTPMKTKTSWNTSVGAVAGALPMLIGYTATGGSLMDLTGWLLVGILVAWQYPHFMSIAWMYREQYGAAGFQMSTTVDPTGKSAGLQSIAGSIALISCSIGLCWMRSNVLGAVVASGFTLMFAWPMLKASIQFNKQPTDRIARFLLRKSLVVLPLLLAVVTIALLW